MFLLGFLQINFLYIFILVSSKYTDKVVLFLVNQGLLDHFSYKAYTYLYFKL